MQIELTPEQEAFIRQGVAGGDYQTPDQALQEALALWELRRRRIIEFRESIDEAEADLAAGRYRAYTNETLPQLAEELKQEARDSQR